MEHRGLLGGVSIALFSLGISLLIAFGTASFARDKEFNWLSGYSIVGESLVLLGVALLVGTIVLIQRQKWKLTEVGRLTGNGNDLMDKLETSITGGTSAVPMDELNLAIVDWEQAVDKWLTTYLPQYAKYFRNRGGHVDLMWENVPPEHMQSSDTASYAVNMTMLSGHLSRLAELTMKL